MVNHIITDSFKKFVFKPTINLFTSSHYTENTWVIGNRFCKNYRSPQNSKHLQYSFKRKNSFPLCEIIRLIGD